MNKFFMGLFTVLTVVAGLSSTATYPVSKGGNVNKLSHAAAQRSVTQAAAARSIRVGSAGFSTGGFSGGGYSGGGYSGGSYRGGK